MGAVDVLKTSPGGMEKFPGFIIPVISPTCSLEVGSIS